VISGKDFFVSEAIYIKSGSNKEKMAGQENAIFVLFE